MKTAIKLLLGAIVGLSSATAYAYTDTGYFRIGKLEASAETAGSYRVYPASGFSLPSICGKRDFAEANPVGSQVERDLMNHLLLSAFLAGRKVTLRLDGCHSSDDRPIYRIVTVNVNQ